MAWFKKSPEQSVAPVTLERIEQVFKQNEWTYDLDSESEAIRTGFAGRFTLIRIIDDKYLCLAIVGSGLVLDSSHYAEARQWANDWNRQTIFGTCVVKVDEEDDLVVRMDVSFDITAGASDEQLDDYVSIAIDCGLQGLNKYAEDFGLEQGEQTEE